MVRVTRYSDNAAANELLEQTGGSDADGAADMVELMKSLGLTHTYMAGGYLIEGGGGSSLLAVVDQPPIAYKHTTAGDMAALATMLVDAAAGQGSLLRHGVSPHEARELLYLMVHAQDPGLVPAGRPRAAGGSQDRLAGRRRQRRGRRFYPPRAAGGRDLQQWHRGLISGNVRSKLRCLTY